MKRHTGSWTVRILSIPKNKDKALAVVLEPLFSVLVQILVQNANRKRSKSIDKTVGIAYTKVAGRDTLYTHITEFAFKCHVLAPAVGPPKGGFLR